MRVFLASVLAAVVLAAAGLIVLNLTQRSAAVAYSTDGARINPKWGWRTLVTSIKGAKPVVTGGLNTTAMNVAGVEGDACETAGALHWLFVDFGDVSHDESTC
jgi:hypothetical protein